jgi:truncated hemoglobin YjbI
MSLCGPSDRIWHWWPDSRKRDSTQRKGELTVQSNPASLYTRLGGYDAIAAMIDDLLPRLRSDELLIRFWVSPRSVDTHNRERQLAVDFIAAAAGGPTFYLGRDMKQ